MATGAQRRLAQRRKWLARLRLLDQSRFDGEVASLVEGWIRAAGREIGLLGRTASLGERSVVASLVLDQLLAEYQAIGGLLFEVLVADCRPPAAIGLSQVEFRAVRGRARQAIARLAGPYAGTAQALPAVVAAEASKVLPEIVAAVSGWREGRVVHSIYATAQTLLVRLRARIDSANDGEWLHLGLDEVEDPIAQLNAVARKQDSR